MIKQDSLFTQYLKENFKHVSIIEEIITPNDFDRSICLGCCGNKFVYNHAHICELKDKDNADN